MTPDDRAPHQDLTHLDEHGRAKMVDVGAKPITDRRARAACTVVMLPATLGRLMEGRVAKGDAFAIARVAGIQGAKRTADLIPLCHPLHLSHVGVEITPQAPDRVELVAEVRAHDRTGVEMEAMTAAAAAGLALYDMIKGVDRTARLKDIRLLEKQGGRTGHWTRPEELSA